MPISMIYFVYLKGFLIIILNYAHFIHFLSNQTEPKIFIPKTHLPISVKRYVYHFYNNYYYFLYNISNSFSATKQNQKDNIT